MWHYQSFCFCSCSCLCVHHTFKCHTVGLYEVEQRKNVAPYKGSFSDPHNVHSNHLHSITSPQLYDLGNPAESQSSSPGCLTTDSSCVNMGFPSCGRHGHCHGEWGSFSCQCVTGYTGQQCDEGKDFCLLIFCLLLRCDIRFLLDFTNTEIKWTSWDTKRI